MRIGGHCVVSGEPCYEVLETWPADHPLAGHPRRLGKPLRGAIRATLVLIDGTLATVTLMKDCLPDLTLQLPRVWDDLKKRYRLDRKSHKELGSPDFNVEQHAIADAVNLHFNDNVPLGVLCWEELDHG